ncbi:endothelin-converting enzyme 1 isoform X2 [Orussus abietinus]|uniref:endothelin-converting enzyme 1 isoform X2 n=1 Tax=Orussus abietinus TaxID=222816 RepID=UPI000626474E|nr:endothelin-converting enzyme 1 isoform X2 [Orussus abietinus]
MKGFTNDNNARWLRLAFIGLLIIVRVSTFERPWTPWTIVSGTLDRTNPRTVHSLRWPLQSGNTESLQTLSNQYEVCGTKACRETADEILQNMNPTLDPCEDFYEFACGGWRKRYAVPHAGTAWNQFVSLNTKKFNQILTILRQSSKPGEIQAVRKAKELFRACMNTEQIEKRGVGPLVSQLQKNGGWPMTISPRAWDSRNFTWQKISQSYAKLIVEFPLFTIDIAADLKNAGVYVATIDQIGLTLPHSVMINRRQHTKHIGTYAKFVKNVALALADPKVNDVSPLTISKDVEDMINFEIELAKLMPLNEERKDLDRIYNPSTISQWQETYNRVPTRHETAKIDWLDNIRTAFESTNVSIEKSERIVIHEKEYLLHLASLLDRTPARTIVNYVHWRFIRHMLTYTNEKLTKLLFNFKRELLGISEEQPRWLKCVVQNEMVHAVSYQFVKNYFSDKAKTNAREMVSEIKKEMESEISRSDWMDRSSKTLAREKLRNVVDFIGYPDWYRSPVAMNSLYSDLAVGPNYFENALNYAKFSRKKTLEFLRRPVHRRQWIGVPMEVNAFYYHSGNSITGILQIPFFDSDLPDAVNYGGIGAVIGHEISHGFDDIGRRFDKNGNIVQWWSNQTIASYNQKARCFINQFNGYVVKELQSLNKYIHANGELTLGENIADSTGLHAAFEAFRAKSKRKPGNRVLLPGLEQFNDEQLFFLSFANTWCDAVRPESLLYTIKTDPHSTSRLRIIGTLSNTESFGEIFQCPTGRPMNPSRKCILWK